MRPRIGFAPVQDITRRANVCVHAANRARSCETPLITGFAAPASLWIIYFPRGLFINGCDRPTCDLRFSPELWVRAAKRFMKSQVWRVQRKPPSIRTTRPFLNLRLWTEHDRSNARKAGPTRRKPEACWMPRNFSCKMKSSSN